MRRTYRNLLSITLFIALAAGGGVMACGGYSNPGEGEDPPPENQNPDPPPQNGKIVHANDGCEGKTGEDDPCYLDETTHREFGLSVKVQKPGGEGAGNRQVNYEIVSQDSSSLLSLATKSDTTNDDGIAEVNIRTSDMETGSGRVKATTTNDELGAAFWDLTISKKGGSAYEVHVKYDGDSTIGEAEVGLFSSSKSCDQLRDAWEIRRNDDFSPTNLPSSLTRDTRRLNLEGNMLQQTFTFGGDDSEVPKTGNSYTVWVRGFKQQNDGTSEPPVELGWGCEDDTAELTVDDTVEVEVNLRDHIPQLREKYTVRHNFDLVDALPDRVENGIRLIGLFVKSPGAFVVGCKPGDTQVERGGEQVDLCPDGEVDGVLDFLGNLNFLPDSIKDYAEQATENAAVRESVRDVLDAYIIDKLFKNVSWANTARKMSEDIYKTVTNFGVKGEMRFETRPSPEYGQNGEPQLTLPEDGTSQSWQEFSFYWRDSQNCEDSEDFQSCRTQWWPAQKFLSGDDRFIEGNFEAHMGGANALHISEHNLNLNFGALVIGAVEQVVLPRYFSDVGSDGGNVVRDVDENEDGTVTFQELLGGTLVNCQSIVDSGDFSSEALEDAVFRLCENFQSAIVDRFKTAIKERLSLNDATVTIKSPEGEPCEIHQPNPYPGQPDSSPKLPYIERLGKVDAKCSWDVNIDFASDTVEGFFYGTSD